MSVHALVFIKLYFGQHGLLWVIVDFIYSVRMLGTVNAMVDLKQFEPYGSLFV